MFDDIEESIVINCDGTAAVAQLDSVSQGVRRITQASAEMGSQFSQRIEHAGLYLFSRQVFGLAGLSDLARHAMGAISLGFEEVAASAGVSVAAIAPWLLVLGAGIAIAEVIVKHNKNHAESLGDIAKKQAEALKTTEGLKEGMAQYIDTVGAMSRAQQDLAATTGALDVVQRRMLEHTEGQQMAALQAKIFADRQALENAREMVPALTAQIEAERHRGEVTEDTRLALEHQRAEVDRLSTSLTVEGQQYAKIKADIEAQGQGFASAEAMMSSHVKTTKEATAAQEALAKALVESNTKAMEAGQAFADYESSQSAKISDLQDSLDNTKEGHITRTYDKMRSAADREFSHEQEVLTKSGMSFQQYNDALNRAAETAASRRIAIDAAEANAKREHWRQFFGAVNSQQEVMLAASQQAFNKMASYFAQNISQMIVYGDAFKEKFTDIMKQVLAMFIQAVVEMEIKWAAFTMLTHFGGFASAGIGAGGGGAAAMSGVTMAATGYDGFVDRPTMFLAGEGGESERVTISPSSKGGGGGQSGGATVVNVTNNFNGITDTRAMVEEVGLSISKAIRGRGQINFQRTT